MFYRIIWVSHIMTISFPVYTVKRSGYVDRCFDRKDQVTLQITLQTLLQFALWILWANWIYRNLLGILPRYAFIIILSVIAYYNKYNIKKKNRSNIPMPPVFFIEIVYSIRMLLIVLYICVCLLAFLQSYNLFYLQYPFQSFLQTVETL